MADILDTRTAKEARAALEKAEKIIKRFEPLGNTKFEEGAEQFVKAGNLFKAARLPDEAAKSYAKAAECYGRVKQDFDAATQLVNAAMCFTKTNRPEAVRCFKQAVDMYIVEGAFGTAARHLQEMAELCEEEGNTEDAIAYFDRASGFYEGENSTTKVLYCINKVALILSRSGQDYEKAISLFEKCAQISLEHTLLSPSAKDYLLKALLCHLARGDLVAAQRALESYQQMDARFANQRECKFCAQLIAAYEDLDEEAFTESTAEFDSTSPLEPWKVSLLLQIKNLIKEGAGTSLA